MQTLAIVSKSTKQGLSVWRFVQTENGEYFAFGGVKPACKAFANLGQLQACLNNWLGYGYSVGLTPTKKSPTAEARKFVPKKQPSELPLDLQMDLWALPATAA